VGILPLACFHALRWADHVCWLLVAVETETTRLVEFYKFTASSVTPGLMAARMARRLVSPAELLACEGSPERLKILLDEKLFDQRSANGGANGKGATVNVTDPRTSQRLTGPSLV
jgi:hypothetical protein